jgi:hypothetical protein
MPNVKGEPADVRETWFRVITDENYWKKDGTLKNSAFGGKAISPPDPARPWSHELSGNLLSLVNDVRGHCVAFCGAKLAGIMYQRVENLRGEQIVRRDDGTRPMIGINVIYTPQASNEAHADLVSYGTAEDKYRLRDWLQDIVQCVRSDKVEAIEPLREYVITLLPS